MTIFLSVIYVELFNLTKLLILNIWLDVLKHRGPQSGVGILDKKCPVSFSAVEFLLSLGRELYCTIQQLS